MLPNIYISHMRQSSDYTKHGHKFPHRMNLLRKLHLWSQKGHMAIYCKRKFVTVYSIYPGRHSGDACVSYEHTGYISLIERSLAI